MWQKKRLLSEAADFLPLSVVLMFVVDNSHKLHDRNKRICWYT